jgi:hypothetical protein
MGRPAIPGTKPSRRTDTGSIDARGRDESADGESGGKARRKRSVAGRDMRPVLAASTGTVAALMFNRGTNKRADVGRPADGRVLAVELGGWQLRVRAEFGRIIYTESPGGNGARVGRCREVLSEIVAVNELNTVGPQEINERLTSGPARNSP